MTLAHRLTRLEARRAGVAGWAVAFVTDAHGEPITANVTRWDGGLFELGRASGEAAETFRLRAGMAAGDMVSTQQYVMRELLRGHAREEIGRT
jgi:hypothetical protein